jgi:hypothetical protein
MLTLCTCIVIPWSPVAEEAAPVASFPSLKDAADAPKVFVTKSSSGSGTGSSARYVPRFGGSNFAGLKKMLEQNNSQSGAGPAAGPKP